MLFVCFLVDVCVGEYATVRDLDKGEACVAGDSGH